ncbi:hypothetical protein HNW13_017730 [Shewanella sp. BF02_Schw]|uniref:hypothetical protein n=1 Tax=Shewanella sp. BF02_Schw TaxID=394908 RepID=UPI00178390DC|nr:hypothetical protein [Shewanella sp. BF02_Schw]MBO1897580.1 hypothetical protein [Shewanella sp. BF02_Schw]
MSDYIATELSKAVVKYNKIQTDYMSINTKLNDCFNEIIQCIGKPKDSALTVGFEQIYVDLKSISAPDDSIINIPSSDLCTFLFEKGCDTNNYNSIHSIKASYLQWYGAEKLKYSDSLKVLLPDTNCRINISEEFMATGKARLLSAVINIAKNANLKIAVACDEPRSISVILNTSNGSSSLNMSNNVFDVIKPLSDAIHSLTAEDFHNLSQIHDPTFTKTILLNSGLTVGDESLPIEVQIAFFGSVMSDFFAGGFSGDKIIDKNQLIRVLQLCESDEDYSIRGFIGSFTLLDYHSSRVQRVFGNGLTGPLENLAIYIECNKAIGRGLVSSTESAVTQMLAHYFAELGFTDRLIAYNKISNHPVFPKTMLDAHHLFSSFAKTNQFALDEYHQCLVLAAAIDCELQSDITIQNLENSNDSTSSLTNSI